MIHTNINQCLDPEDEPYTEDNDVMDLTEDELITVDRDENPETGMWT